jgi:hypothetical protein
LRQPLHRPPEIARIVDRVGREDQVEGLRGQTLDAIVDADSLGLDPRNGAVAGAPADSGDRILGDVDAEDGETADALRQIEDLLAGAAADVENALRSNSAAAL